jgi:NTE family protein
LARFDRVALVLSGGGALGAYQAGAYAALEKCGVRPNWIAGTAIGAMSLATGTETRSTTTGWCSASTM